MTTICAHCGHRSRVVETRQVLARLSVSTKTGERKRMRRSRTVCRLRECSRPTCRWRWKTMEMPMRPGSRMWSAVAREPISRTTRMK